MLKLIEGPLCHFPLDRRPSAAVRGASPIAPTVSTLANLDWSCNETEESGVAFSSLVLNECVIPRLNRDTEPSCLPLLITDRGIWRLFVHESVTVRTQLQVLTKIESARLKITSVCLGIGLPLRVLVVEQWREPGMLWETRNSHSQRTSLRLPMCQRNYQGHATVY